MKVNAETEKTQKFLKSMELQKYCWIIQRNSKLGCRSKYKSDEDY